MIRQTTYAFPRRLPDVELAPDDALACIHQHAGMSLRDYFAGQAILGLVTYYTEKAHTATDLAETAYQYAEAMMQAREKEVL